MVETILLAAIFATVTAILADDAIQRLIGDEE